MSIKNKIKGMGFVAGLVTGGTSATAAVLHLLGAVPASSPAVAAWQVPPTIFWMIALTTLVLGNVALFRTGQKALKLALHAQAAAQSDSLTSLPNRRAFGNAIKQIQTGAGDRSCGVLMIDLDRFKSINDQLGHVAGDRVLQQISLRLLQVCDQAQRPFRLGGDEFAVVVQDLHDLETLDRLRHDLETVIAAPIHGDGWSVVVTCSIGHAVGPVGPGFDLLIQAADQKMYLQKKARKTRTASASIRIIAPAKAQTQSSPSGAQVGFAFAGNR